MRNSRSLFMTTTLVNYLFIHHKGSSTGNKIHTHARKIYNAINVQNQNYTKGVIRRTVTDSLTSYCIIQTAIPKLLLHHKLMHTKITQTEKHRNYPKGVIREVHIYRVAYIILYQTNSNLVIIDTSQACVYVLPDPNNCILRCTLPQSYVLRLQNYSRISQVCMPLCYC